MDARARRGAGRAFRPKVEALEALRLLDADLLPSLHGVAIEQVAAEVGTLPSERAADAIEAAWDAALGESEFEDFLTVAEEQPTAPRMVPGGADLSESAYESGLHQLTRYLGRTWSRAGIGEQRFEDCTQGVFVSLLERLGRDGFDRLVSDVGQRGVREVLNGESELGLDFFRAVDMIKKRDLRTERHLSLEDPYGGLVDRAGSDGASADWRRALYEAIEISLTGREALLIRQTLAGYSPADIAADWGVAPKTVSNEKARAIAKLRATLLAEIEA